MNQTAQITFIADKDLKNSALAMAKEQGITLKAVLTMAMRSYVSGAMRFGLSMNDAYDPIFADKEVIDATNKLGKALQSRTI